MVMSLPKSTSRAKRSDAEIRSLLHAQQGSALSVKDFCQEKGLSRALFYHWRSKYLSGPVTVPGFLPIQMPREEKFENVFAEIEFPGNRVLRLFRDVDPSYLATLLRS